jgi:hypothetical protein
MGGHLSIIIGLAEAEAPLDRERGGCSVVPCVY